MLNWLKRILGISPVETTKPLVLTEAEQVKEVAKPKKQAKKPAAKKTKKIDYTSMSKKDLLNEAKKRGIPANASLKKERIIERLQNS